MMFKFAAVAIIGLFQSPIAVAEAVDASVCDEYTENQANGLCVAFQAKDCDDVDKPPCSVLANKFFELTGVVMPGLLKPTTAPTQAPSASVAPSSGPTQAPSVSVAPTMAPTSEGTGTLAPASCPCWGGFDFSNPQTSLADWENGKCVLDVSSVQISYYDDSPLNNPGIPVQLSVDAATGSCFNRKYDLEFVGLPQDEVNVCYGILLQVCYVRVGFEGRI